MVQYYQHVLWTLRSTTTIFTITTKLQRHFAIKPEKFPNHIFRLGHNFTIINSEKSPNICRQICKYEISIHCLMLSKLFLWLRFHSVDFFSVFTHLLITYCQSLPTLFIAPIHKTICQRDTFYRIFTIYSMNRKVC